MKRFAPNFPKWIPIVLLLIGVGIYVYYGVTTHAWRQNFADFIVYTVVMLTLLWALLRKDEKK